jgi:hypothetical protein
MSMPGFTAQRSLYRPSGRYQLASHGGGTGGQRVTSQQDLAPGAAAPAPAPAVVPQFTTPVYGLDCTTSTSGSFGAYYGNASCRGTISPGKWRVSTSCSFGFTYSSPWYYISPGELQTLSAGPCLWGVDSVTVEEAR